METNKINSAAITSFAWLAAFSGDYLLFGLSNDRPLTKRPRKVSDNSVGRNSMLCYTDQTRYCILVLTGLMCKSPTEKKEHAVATGLHLYGIHLENGRLFHPEKKCICI